MPAVVAVSLLCLFITCIPFISCGKINEETNDKNVTIRPWQYCEGCKITSDMYSRAVNDHILLLKKSRKSKTVDAMGLLDHFCDRDEFSEYRSFIKMSCIKILDEFRVTFLESFQGNATETSMTNKKELYARKKHLCLDTVKACPLSSFEYPPAIGQKRNKCAACYVIATDIDAVRSILHADTSLISVLERDEYCDRLGFNFPQYSWLESLCEEIMEDKTEHIMEVVDFHDQVSRTGFKPSQTMPQMLCEELYGCNAEMKEDKSKIKKVTKKKKKKDVPIGQREL